MNSAAGALDVPVVRPAWGLSQSPCCRGRGTFSVRAAGPPCAARGGSSGSGHERGDPPLLRGPPDPGLECPRRSHGQRPEGPRGSLEGRSGKWTFLFSMEIERHPVGSEPRAVGWRPRPDREGMMRGAEGSLGLRNAAQGPATGAAGGGQLGPWTTPTTPRSVTPAEPLGSEALKQAGSAEQVEGGGHRLGCRGDVTWLPRSPCILRAAKSWGPHSPSGRTQLLCASVSPLTSRCV